MLRAFQPSSVLLCLQTNAVALDKHSVCRRVHLYEDTHTLTNTTHTHILTYTTHIHTHTTHRVNSSSTSIAALQADLTRNAHAALARGAARKDASALKLHQQQQQGRLPQAGVGRLSLPPQFVPLAGVSGLCENVGVGVGVGVGGPCVGSAQCKRAVGAADGDDECGAEREEGVAGAKMMEVDDGSVAGAERREGRNEGEGNGVGGGRRG